MGLAEVVSTRGPTVSTGTGGSAEIQSLLIVPIEIASGLEAAERILKVCRSPEFPSSEFRAKTVKPFGLRGAQSPTAPCYKPTSFNHEVGIRSLLSSQLSGTMAP